MILFRAIHKKGGYVFSSRNNKSVFESKNGLVKAISYHPWSEKDDYRIEFVQINEESWEELK